jgi:pimeloyl-ACP methyl ester carboxylesterase
MRLWDEFWHKRLKRPFRLHKNIDEGSGLPVVLLHSIGKSGGVWHHVIKLLEGLEARIITFDLLGFGDSPKPAWVNYDIDDHAQAVIASLERLRLGEPAILVGHSMGCLVAVRVAALHPELVRHLVLYEMPLYEGLPQKRRYRLRTDLYFAFYRKIAEFKPAFNQAEQRLVERWARTMLGLDIGPEIWQPFIRSLENTIMKQTAADDIKKIYVPMDVIYGSFDMLVIRGKPREFFGNRDDNFKAFTIRARHVISLKAAKFIVSRIEAAMHATLSAKALRQVEETIRD